MDLSEDSHSPQVADSREDVIDFLLKRCSKFMKLRTSHFEEQKERAAGLRETLPQLETQLSTSPKIAIKTKGRILFADPAEIAVVEAKGKYVLLWRNSGTDLLRQSISTISDKFKPYGLIRIHRSVPVNASFVEEFFQPF